MVPTGNNAKTVVQRFKSASGVRNPEWRGKSAILSGLKGIRSGNPVLEMHTLDHWATPTIAAPRFESASERGFESGHYSVEKVPSKQIQRDSIRQP